MTMEQLRKAVHADPFQPFTICLADGRQFRVNHPELVLAPRDANRTFVVAQRGEDYSVLDLLLVTSLDLIKPAKRHRKGGNGKP